MFSDNLKKVRSAREWSQQHAADKLKVKLRTYQAWEEGRSCPNAYGLVPVAMLFKITDLAAFLSDPDYMRDDTKILEEQKKTPSALEEKYLEAGIKEKLAVNILLGLVDLE